MPKIIGITGSISVGKSTVTKYLRKQGFQVVDADVLSHDAYYNKECRKQIEELFDCYDDKGILDRKKLGAIVFNDKEKKKQLEVIIHPFVHKKMLELINNCCDKVIFLDIPLLYESKMDNLCDEVIVVYIPKDLQVKRLMNRNHISEEQALHLISQQMSLEEKRNLADYIVDNSGDLDFLHKNVNDILGKIL